MKFINFCKKKNVFVSKRVYYIDVLGSMAIGLFASLLIGTILNTVGQKINSEFLTKELWPVCRDMTGAAIAAAIALSLKAPKLVMLSSVAVGYFANIKGGPVGALIASVLSIEIGKLISKETKLDIILTPAAVVISGMLAAKYIGPPMSALMTSLGELLMRATELRPFFMGIVVSVMVGMILTLPISSAALCMMIGLEGLAGGAATAGCCAQMLGFAVISYKANGFKGLLAQGLGTSMLQIPNIMKNYRIWIGPTLASAVSGPVATVIFRMKNSALGSGMGTSGLVGVIETFNTMLGKGNDMLVYTGVLISYILLPILVSLTVYKFQLKRGTVKEEDLKLIDID